MDIHISQFNRVADIIYWTYVCVLYIVYIMCTKINSLMLVLFNIFYIDIQLTKVVLRMYQNFGSYAVIFNNITGHF